MESTSSLNPIDIQNVLLNNDNLESIFQMLKGDSKELKRSQIKKIFDNFEAREEKIKIDIDTKEDEDEIVSYEEFCLVFKNIFDSSQNPKNILTEGFALIDKNKYNIQFLFNFLIIFRKGYLEIEDIKKICTSMDQPLSENDLQGN